MSMKLMVLQIQSILSAVQDSISGNLHQDDGNQEDGTAADSEGLSALSRPFLTPAKEDLVEAERKLLEQV